MTNEEAINYLKFRQCEMCLDCGRCGSSACDSCKEAEAYDKAIEALEKQISRKPDEQPTVDAVEVVRCKDCRWSFMIGEHRQCNFMAGDLNDEWFCSHGRRESKDAD